MHVTMTSSTWAHAWARGALAPPLPSENVVTCFCELVVTAKRSVHYFHNPSSASGGFTPIPQLGLYPWTPLGKFRLQTPNLPTPRKNPARAHEHRRCRSGTESGWQTAVAWVHCVHVSDGYFEHKFWIYDFPLYFIVLSILVSEKNGSIYM